MIEFKSIGIIHSPFKALKGMPNQPAGATGVQETVEVFEEYHDGLKDLEGFSHIILLYHLHCSNEFKLNILPFMDLESQGLFTTRAPSRPNPIGLSVIRLDRMENAKLHIQNVDIIDDTPLLDIKPYNPEFDAALKIRAGWLENARHDVSNQQSDERLK